MRGSGILSPGVWAGLSVKEVERRRVQTGHEWVSLDGGEIKEFMLDGSYFLNEQYYEVKT